MKIKKYRQFITKARQLEGENLALIPLLFKLATWIIKNRGRLIYFYQLELHKKSKRVKDFLTENEFLKVHNRLNPPYYIALLEDKFVFDRFLKSFGFPLAELEAIIQYRRIRWINNQLIEPLENIINYDLNCFVKMHLNWGGNQVYKLDIKDKAVFINNKESDLQSLMKKIGDETFILQKTLIQHPEMNRLNSSSINTLRIVTIHNGERILIYEKVLRIGIRGSIVDNASQGNLLCGIYEDGTLYKTASSAQIDLNWITHHPSSNVEFKSFKIPFFQEAIDLTIKLHNAYHCFFVIGWDIAITENGPAVIEGNPIGDLIWAQVLEGGKKKEFMSFAASFEKLHPMQTRTFNK
jgi:hypothetical protein